MASDLKWRTGFDWGSVLIFVAGGATALLADGWTRIAGLVLAILSLLFMVTQYRKWNTRGWRSVHFRAMLAYARVAAEETVRAREEGRPFDRAIAGRNLALLLCGAEKAPNVDAMIEALKEEKGAYFASLLRRQAHVLFPSAEPQKLERLYSQLQPAEFGPQLVICNVIENSFGELEAARYVIALIENAAH